MKKVFHIFIFLICLFPLSVSATFAQNPQSYNPQQMLKGKIIKQLNKELDANGKLQKITFSVKLEDEKVIQGMYTPSTLGSLNLENGSNVVIAKTKTQNGPTYQIIDTYRLPYLVYFLIVFVIIAVLIVGKRGIGSLIGLIISLIVILYGIVPLILKGYDPLLVTIFFSFIILFFTTYLAHGVSKPTTIALVSTFISLLMTLGISALCITLLDLNGLGNENVYDLYFATGNIINAKGLLLSGIVIGTLGALNDVTVTQAVTLFEIMKLNHKLTFVELVRKGLSIGREHGASMVNTLVLAYAGSSLFLFIFFLVNPQKQPIWAILNNEFMVEEIVISLGGTMGILLSVPIVTMLAAFVAHKTFSGRGGGN